MVSKLNFILRDIMKHPCKIQQHQTHPGRHGSLPWGPQPRGVPQGSRRWQGTAWAVGTAAPGLSAPLLLYSSALANPPQPSSTAQLPKREIKIQPESHTTRRIIPGKHFCSPGALHVHNRNAIVPLAPPSSAARFRRRAHPNLSVPSGTCTGI